MNIESKILDILHDHGWPLQRICDELTLQGTDILQPQVAAALQRLRLKSDVKNVDGVWHVTRRRSEPKPARVRPEGDKSESRIQREVMIAASQRGYTLWRNNTGRAWQGKRIDVSGAKVTFPGGRTMHIDRGILLLNYRPVEFGLCKGSSDLVGLRGFEITAEHVGQKIAQFVAIEIKTKSGGATPEQKHFLRFVGEAGGEAILARDKDDLPTGKI